MKPRTFSRSSMYFSLFLDYLDYIEEVFHMNIDAWTKLLGILPSTRNPEPSNCFRTSAAMSSLS